MYTINMPGFAAEASLYIGKYRSTRRYTQEALREQRGELQRTAVIPQLPNKDAPGKAGCIIDCVDSGGTFAHCSKVVCRDPGGTHGSGDAYGPSCDNNPPGECLALFLGCCAGFGFELFGCAAVCTSIQNACLDNSRRECNIARHGPLRGGTSYPRSGVVTLYGGYSG